MNSRRLLCVASELLWRTPSPAPEARYEAAGVEDELRSLDRSGHRQRHDVLAAALVGEADLDAARLVLHLERNDFVGIESHVLLSVEVTIAAS